MDSFDNIPPIVGSRCPILVPAYPDDHSSSSHTPTPPLAVAVKSTPVSSLRSRRKPANVFKSPSADEPGEWEAHTSTRKRVTPPYERVTPRRASTSTDTSRSSNTSVATSAKITFKSTVPALPLYHPLGPLAQSLPPLDPAVFGLPSSLSIDDSGDQNEGEPGGNSSRARRAPKSRENGEEEPAANGTPDKGLDAPARDRNASPRKRRGGGAKRKRRDTDDADAGFPPPAKRTRNPRGAAANSSAPAAPSPLVGPAVVASDLVDDIPEDNGEAEEAPQEVQAPKRGARTRKPRARPAKRRNSSGSASSGTSVSVSIAAATKAAALGPKPSVTAEAAQPQAEVSSADLRPVNDTTDTKLKDETIPDVTPTPIPAPAQAEAPSANERKAAAAAVVTPPAANGDTPVAADVIPRPQPQPERETKTISPSKMLAPAPAPATAAPLGPVPKSLPPKPKPALPPAPAPAPAPTVAPAPHPAPLPSRPPPKEEREEGELSDD